MRNKQILIRLTEDEKKEIVKYAGKKSIAKYLRDCHLEHLKNSGVCWQCGKKI